MLRPPMLDTAKKLHLAGASQEEGTNASTIDPLLHQPMPGRRWGNGRLPGCHMESACVMQRFHQPSWIVAFQTISMGIGQHGSHGNRLGKTAPRSASPSLPGAQGAQARHRGKTGSGQSHDAAEPLKTAAVMLGSTC